LDESQAPAVPALQTLLAERIAELTALFLAQRKRTGGNRASYIAETWATILARRELGESLQAIAEDLEMRYETVKTYAKLARQELRKLQSDLLNS
jgi:CRISPR-associated endoribonuclease Cas6